jgi:hypothetical protein
MKSQLIPLDFDESNPVHVTLLQDVLTFLGVKIDPAEITLRVIGLTTKEAMYNLSKRLCLSCGCEINEAFINEINKIISKCYKIQGTILNENGAVVEGLTINVYRYFFKQKETTVIGTSKSINDGSYCVFLQPQKHSNYNTQIGEPVTSAPDKLTNPVSATNDSNSSTQLNEFTIIIKLNWIDSKTDINELILTSEPYHITNIETQIDFNSLVVPYFKPKTVIEILGEKYREVIGATGLNNPINGESAQTGPVIPR